ncbi:MAG: hypothetical protein K9K87_09510 [Desulfotignum sp.]|nr:hypothetical protein [Desulfotignum sp.]
MEQLFHVEEDANFDTGLVLEALLAHAKTKMQKLIDAFDEHLGGRVFFLEILPRQTTMYDQKTTGDIAGILVEKVDNEGQDTMETEKEVSA